jgi:predicted dehydrogenase
MPKSGNPTRRDFMKLAAIAGPAAAAYGEVLAAASAQPVAANDRIQLALIGAGIQGVGDAQTALRVPAVELVAVADLYDGRLERARELWGTGIKTTRDHREVLARADVDAIIIATPDHWHIPIALDALKAGKDVYIEKPMMQRIDEAQPIIEAQRETRRIVQVGSQRVSSIVYAKAKELIAGGAIGELNLIEVRYNRNSAQGAWQYSIPLDASPQTVDWDRFLGRAPKRPFDATRFFRWRNYQDYGTGVAGDLFVHLFSGIHFILDSLGPTRAMTTGGLRFWKDGRDVPDVMMGLFDYPKTASHPAFNMFLQVNFANGGGEEQAFRFVGDEGELLLGGGAVTVRKRPRSKAPGESAWTFSKAQQEAFLKQYYEKYPEERGRTVEPQGTEQVYRAPGGYNDSYDHFVNFFNSVRTRQTPVEDAVFGARAAGPALLSNLSYFDGRPYGWNPGTMRVTNGSRT